MSTTASDKLKATRSFKELAIEAIQVQDACNMCGLSKAFSRTVQDITNNLRLFKIDTGTDQVNQHPIVKLWVSKLHDLARMGFSDTDAYCDAYTWCRNMADEGMKVKHFAYDEPCFIVRHRHDADGGIILDCITADGEEIVARACEVKAEKDDTAITKPITDQL